MILSKRILLLSSIFSVSFHSFAKNNDILDVNFDNFAIGINNASVTLVEYGSITCSHCIDFHKKTFPIIKSSYIDAKRVKYIFRPFIRNNADAVSLAYLRYLAMNKKPWENVFYRLFDQNKIISENNIVDILEKISDELNIKNELSIINIINDKKVNIINQTVLVTAQERFSVNGTPTFFIVGENVERKIIGAAPLSEFQKSFDQ